MNQKIRVLLVDDEKQFVTNMARILKVRGFDVTTAFDGYQAVDAIKYGGGFDVVVLDVKMPGLDGVATLGEIKKWAPDTEVIMLTGHATLESGTQAMRKGAYDYLMKPCDIEDLVEKIKEAHEAEEIKRHPVLWPRKLVREIALHAFKKLHPEDAVSSALEIMSREEGEESIEEVYVVDREDRPLGIVTKRDLVSEAQKVYVVDREDRLLGIVTKRDLVNEAQKVDADIPLDWAGLIQNPHWLPQKTMKDVMRPQPLTTQANAYLTDAANQMIVHNLRRMPVVRAEKMIGVIKLEDVFQYLDHEIE